MGTITLSGNAYLTTVASGNISGTEITTGDSDTTVEVASAKVEQDFQNDIKELKTPKSNPPAKGGSDVPKSKLINLLRIRNVITVTGFLHDEESEVSKTKRDNIVTLFNYGGNIRVVWGTGTNQIKESGQLVKMKITSTPEAYEGGVNTPANTPYSGFEIVAQVLVGEDRRG